MMSETPLTASTSTILKKPLMPNQENAAPKAPRLIANFRNLTVYTLYFRSRQMINKISNGLFNVRILNLSDLAIEF